MPDTVTGADILARARSYIGKFTDDDADELAREVGQKWPEMASYAAMAKNGTHWCGIFCAKVLSEFDIRPPFGSTDVQRWMWVDAWKPFGSSVPVSQRQPGDLCLWLGNPHHISIYAGGKYVGGNQSDAVTETMFRDPDVVRRAPVADGAASQPIETAPASLPLLVYGDTGPYVEKLQKLLGVEVDGEFGDDTQAAVEAFQARHPQLEVDGEVGPQTWAALFGKPIPTSGETLPPKYLQYRNEYAEQWRRMEITQSVDAIARKLLASKARYQVASSKTLVPWFVIAAWHERESSADFSTQLAQGDPLNQVSTHVPAGRGPFSSWEAGAFDALVTLKALNTVADWTVERIAYESERYNGWGYRNRGVPSAYVWSFSNIYKGGKYVADGVWSASTFDKQAGVMPMVKRLSELDDSIVLRSFKDAPPIEEPEEPELPEEAEEPEDLETLMARVADIAADLRKKANTLETLHRVFQEREQEMAKQDQPDLGAILQPVIKALLPELLKVLPALLPGILPKLLPLIVGLLAKPEPKPGFPQGTIPGVLGLGLSILSGILGAKGVIPSDVGTGGIAAGAGVAGFGATQMAQKK